MTFSTLTTDPVVEAAAFERSDFHLTPEQIQFFDTHGYLILRNWIPAALLARLQDAGHVWIDQGLNAGASDPNFSDYIFANREHGRVMYRVDYLHNKGEVAALELLGSPAVLGVAESLCGRNFVPTYESMVFKQEGDGAVIRWHQDAVYPRTRRIFNFDLYLDRSTKDAGALKVIPGTQTQKQDFCQLEDQHGWDHPDAIYVEMEPGDVLLHDVMVVHGSAQVAGKALRRTIYYEFRSAEEILEDGPWDREWIERRLRLVPLAVKRYAQAFPHEEAFQWNVEPEYRPQMSDDEDAELKIVHLVHMSPAFCSAGDAVKK